MEGIVVLGDIKGSRALPNRQLVSLKFRNALREINAAAKGHLVADFRMQKGVDEFAGILRADANPSRILLHLCQALHPAAARFAVVRGQLDVVPGKAKTNVSDYDGPAFHVAARLLTEADSQDRLISYRVARDPDRDDILMIIANLVYFHWLNWTPRQLELFRAYRLMGLQEKVAQEFGITQPTVSLALSPLRPTFMFIAENHLLAETMRALREA